MIEKINLNNFKCYQKNTFEISKITLLTGANSSGKSSLMYSILSTIQSGEFPFHFSPNGKYIKMGDFEEIVYKHEGDNLIKIEFFLDDLGLISTTWKSDGLRNLPQLQTLTAKYKYYNLSIEKVRKYNVDFEYFIEKDEEKDYRSPDLIKKIFEVVKTNTLLKKQNIKNLSFDKLNSKINFKFSDFNEFNKIISSSENYYLYSVINDIKRKFISYDENINYISSFRLFPERTYYETSKSDLKVGKFGENYEDQIIYWETTKSNKFKDLIEILKKLDLLDDIKSRRMEGGRFEILIKSKPDGIWSSLTDVGFGISQFLPIIVADLQLSDSSTLFIAQPEIHLHPKVQALFADYMIERISKSKKKYFIETHSEYLINRIRLGLAKRDLSEEDVKTYYIENNGIKATQHNIALLKNGQIKDAPDSFFDTYMLDVMNLAIEAE